jgi:hypothetical protein
VLWNGAGDSTPAGAAWLSLVVHLQNDANNKMIRVVLPVDGRCGWFVVLWCAFVVIEFVVLQLGRRRVVGASWLYSVLRGCTTCFVVVQRASAT